MTFKEALNFFDFTYEKYPDGYGLIDLQEANLAQIEDERYTNPIELLDRLISGYGEDYLLDVEEQISQNFWEAAANDKTLAFGIVYYSNHPEELEDLPETLSNEVKEVYYKAREMAEEEIQNKAAEKGCSCYSLLYSHTDTPHYLHAVCFKNEQEQQEWINGTFPKGKYYPEISVDVTKYMPDIPEIENDIDEI